MSSAKQSRAAPPHNRSPRTTRGSQPGNRPPGAPQVATGAFMAFFVVEAFTLIELYGCLVNILGFGFSSGYLLVEIPVAAAFLLGVLVGLSKGKLWAVKLFRWSTHTFAIAYPAIVVCSIYLFGKTPDGSALAWVFLGLTIVQIPALLVLYRAFARVRWLDPKSLPQEWEPPSRPIDPAPSGNQPKRGFFGWLFTCAAILAITIRYYIGILRMEWFQAWMSSGDLWKEFATLIVLLVPVLIAVGCFATRRAAFWRRRIG